MTTIPSFTSTPTLIPSPTPSSYDSSSSTAGGDSPLSATASIISILTFALGLLASYIALQSATRGAPSDIARLVDDLRSTQHEINRVAEYIFDDAQRTVALRERVGEDAGIVSGGGRRLNHDDGGGGGSVGRPSGAAGISRRGVGVGAVPTISPEENLYKETQILVGNCVRLFIEADHLLKRSRADAERWDLEGLRRRIVFVMNRHEVAEKMQRLEDQKARLASVQMSLFMRKSALQDRILGDLLVLVREMQRAEKGEEEGESQDSGVVVVSDAGSVDGREIRVGE